MSNIMRNSKIDDAWLQEAWRNNPVSAILDPATGQPTGNFRTGPVRLAFVNLFQAKAAKGSTNAKFGATVMFPPFANLNLLVQTYYEGVRRFFPAYQVQADGSVPGLHNPFHNGNEKPTMAGYTPGAFYINTTTKFKPQVVDPTQNPIVDDARVYSGVWAIIALNLYHYGISPPQPKKGVTFGLQSVMIVADDENLGGAGIDPRKAFAGISIAANFNVGAQFGQPAGGVVPGAIIPGGGMPGGSFPTQPLPGAAVDPLAALR